MRSSGAALPAPQLADGVPRDGSTPPLKMPPPLSKLGERMGRTDRTRAARANSLKGQALTQKQPPVSSGKRGEQSAGAERNVQQLGAPREGPATSMNDNAEKTESLDLQQMPIVELDAMDLAETDLDSDELEEIDPESTLIEEISADGEAVNVEAEFARALQEELDEPAKEPEPARATPRPGPATSADGLERASLPEAALPRRFSTDLERATGTTDRFEASAPTPSEGALADGALCLLKSAQAQQHYRQKLAPMLTQGSSSSPRRAWANAALFGQELFATGRPLPARKVFERLVAQDPTEAFPYAMLGSLHLAQGEDEEALALYEQALEIDSTDLCALLGRAEIHLRAADPVEALVDVQTAINQARLDESPLLPRALSMMSTVQKLIGFLG